MDLQDLKQRLIAGTSVTFLGSCATLSFGLLLTVVLGKALDLQSFGLMMAAVSTASLTWGFLDVRFGEAVIKFGVDFVANGEREKALGLIRFSYLVELGLALFVFAIMFFPASFIAKHIYCKPETETLIRIAAFIPLLGFSTATSTAVLRAFQRFGDITAGVAFAGALRFLLPVLLCLFCAGPERDIRYILPGYPLAALAATLIFAGLAWRTVRREFPGVKAASIRSDLRQVVPFVLLTFLSNIFKALSRGDLAVAMVTRWRTAVEVSYLKIGLQVSGMLTVIPSSVGFVTFPSFAELWAKNERKMFLHVIRRLAQGLALLMAAGAVLVLVVVPPFIKVWKSDFLPAMNVIYWLVAAAAVDGVCCWIRPASLSLGKPWISTLVNLVRMVVLVGLGCLLVPEIGYVGIGVATLALAVLSMGLGAFLVLKSVLSEQQNDERNSQTG